MSAESCGLRSRRSTSDCTATPPRAPDRRSGEAWLYLYLYLYLFFTCISIAIFIFVPARRRLEAADESALFDFEQGESGFDRQAAEVFGGMLRVEARLFERKCFARALLASRLRLFVIGDECNASGQPHAFLDLLPFVDARLAGQHLLGVRLRIVHQLALGRN